MNSDGYGVIYAKDPEKIMSMLSSIPDPDNYIFLHLKNKSNWGRMLAGKFINPKKVVGINIEALVDHGAIVPNMVEPFSGEEILYILCERFINSNVSTIEIIQQFRKDVSAADIYRLRRQIKDIRESVKKKLF